jgi:hypothetical protein
MGKAGENGKREEKREQTEWLWEWKMKRRMKHDSPPLPLLFNFLYPTLSHVKRNNTTHVPLKEKNNAASKLDNEVRGNLPSP